MASLLIEKDAIELEASNNRESENEHEEFYSPTWRSSCDDDGNKEDQQYEDEGIVSRTSDMDGNIRSLGPIVEEIEVKSSWRVAHMNAQTVLNWRWRTLSTIHTINGDTQSAVHDTVVKTNGYSEESLSKMHNSALKVEPLSSEKETTKDTLPQQMPEVTDVSLLRDEKSRTNICHDVNSPGASSTSAAIVVDERHIAHDLAAEALMLMADALNFTPDRPTLEGSLRSPICAPAEPSQEERDSWSSLSRHEQDFLNDGIELERLISEHKIDEADCTGLTALQRASMRGHGAYVELLLGLGADSNRTGGTGASSDSLRAPVPPVALALQAGHVEIAEALFEHGATLDWYDKNGGQGGATNSGFQWWGRKKR